MHNPSPKSGIRGESACNDSVSASESRDLASSEPVTLPHPDNAVAVIGTACKYAGADSLEQLWDILEAGQSQCRDLSNDRFPEWRFRRSNQKNFKANTIDDVDAFDHKFFKITSREASFMDPQQRLALQVGYQALESAGYFSCAAAQRELDMGCYMAVTANDYYQNIACHASSAFSSTGSIRPFIAGRISHYFGWTGPAIVYDTACSGSGTAIHQACRAIVTGECQTALAGATNIFVSPEIFEDLAAAHFTSTTGASKAFDVAADGYCRGEGVAFVVLKKLSTALRDGDTIRGVVASTAISQNANETSITVPHGPSQTSLYRKGLRLAGLDAQDISYIEAHGTGTPVGDPIEAASIRSVFGNSCRTSKRNTSETTYFGSIKSNIGHTEAASGVSGLIKVLMMLQKGTIPPQALFENLNPAIAPLGHGIEISRSNIPWTAKFKAACVNNYGASGSNAVIFVTQSPDVTVPATRIPFTTSNWPVSITAFSPSSLASYCSALLDFTSQFTKDDSIADITYHLSRRMNLDLPYSTRATVTSLRDLKDLLRSTISRQPHINTNRHRPVVMFFGGQTGRVADVPRAFYDTCTVFRKHLDDCDSVLQALGVSSIFPAIFEHTPRNDIVVLHSMLFCGQYASAMAWLDCGLRPARLIGHSFGQLTAMCVSGVLSLQDGLRLVVERARLVAKAWEDPGSMIAIEADPNALENLLMQQANLNLRIACRNGLRSFVVAGSMASVNTLEAILQSSPGLLQWKRLQVTNAFHCPLAEPLVRPLQGVAEQLSFCNAKIPIEICSEDSYDGSITPALIASHISEPVYFYQAVGRISKQLDACTWVEAGMGTGAPILRRALGTKTSFHNIKSMDLDSTSSLEPLSKLTSELWASGIAVRFWPFHQSQCHQYERLNLPPYQFDKARHWLDWKDPAPHIDEARYPAPVQTSLLQLLRECETWQKTCRYQQMSIEGLQRALLRTVGAIEPQVNVISSPVSVPSEIFSFQSTDSVASTFLTDSSPPPTTERMTAKTHKLTESNILETCRDMLCNLSGVEPEEIQDKTDLIELGIDSLMFMEVVREVNIVFKCKLSNEQLMELTDFKSLVSCIRAALSNGHEDGEGGTSGDETKNVETQASLLNYTISTNVTKGSSGDALQTSPRDHVWFEKDLTSTKETAVTRSIVEDNCLNVLDDNQALESSSGPVEINPPTMTGEPGVSFESIVLNAFQELKHATDDFITREGLAGYCSAIVPKWSELCIVYIIDAFEQLGCAIRSAAPGQRLERASHLPKHKRLVDLFYNFLEHTAGLITTDGHEIRRTVIPLPKRSVDVLLAEIVHNEQIHTAEYKLIALIGSRLAPCLMGQAEGVQILFSEGREVLADWYANSPLAKTWISQLEVLIKQIVEELPTNADPLCILEIGAGTGGTTGKLVPMLALLGRPVRYTVTDLSGSLVAAARKRFSQYPFVEFKVVDIESKPDTSLVSSQHIVVSTQCIHATRNLYESVSNIHRMLRSDGCLVLVESTQQLPWVDFVFGLVKGWWLFEDDRTHALASKKQWENALKSAGYGCIDWTEGELPEASIQHLIIAQASHYEHEHRQELVPPLIPEMPASVDSHGRQAMIGSYVQRYTEGWAVQQERGLSHTDSAPSGRCVLVTGATGSLGSHVVHALAQRPDIQTVICLNRLSHQDADVRQQKSFETRGIEFIPSMRMKLKVIATDMSKPMLGLLQETYDNLVHEVTDIVHSAWPMSLTRPIRGYEIQFKVMRNLLDLAQKAADHRPDPFIFGFQFISSMAVVANYPALAGKTVVPEQLTGIDAVPNAGYPEAKATCEYMLNQTLHRHPDRFHAMTVRIAQISGSAISGHWNHTEYIPILMKSAQSLHALPDLDGTLSWCPVDQVATSLDELMRSEIANDFIYHIDNPSRQSWKHLIAIFARQLSIPPENIVPHDEWTKRVSQFEGPIQQNPALQLIEFFKTHFVPLSCSGLMLDVEKAAGYSSTLRSMGVIDDGLLKRYVEAWKESGYLQST